MMRKMIFQMIWINRTGKMSKRYQSLDNILKLSFKISGGTSLFVCFHNN